MGFLSNKSVNYLNLHNGFVELLNQIVLVFGAIFLYQHGFSIAGVFLTMSVMAGGRIFSRFLAFPAIRFLGLRKAVALGLTGFGTAILMLSQAHGLDGWFVAYITLFILLNPVYWVCFHIYYTLMGDAEHRGKQYAVRSAIILSGQALFPILSAAIIKLAGYNWYFTISIPITLAALMLLLRCPDASIPKSSWAWSREQLFSVGVRTSIFQSFYESISNNAWIFVVFLFTGSKLVSLSGIVAFGIAAQIILQLLIGKHFDSGKAGRIANTGGLAMTATILGRVFAPLSLPIVLGLELFNSVARLHIRSVSDVATYNDSHRAEHIVWYWVFTETTRDVGNILGTLSVALLLMGGMDLRMAILISLAGLLMLWQVQARCVGNPVN